MKILILGAAGQISQLVTKGLLKESNHELVLFARNASRRLNNYQDDRVTLIDGDFNDRTALQVAMKNVDVIYLNDMGQSKATENIVETMKAQHVNKIIGASILGIYDEVAGKFGVWNNQMIGHSPRLDDQKTSAQIIENSGLTYTLLRLTWLYNNTNDTDYALTEKGEPFIGAEVSREAVTKLITDIIADDTNVFDERSIGVYSPGSEKLSKPSFY